MSHIYLVVLFPNNGIIRFVDWVVNDTQCAVCKRYFRGNRGLNQHLIQSNCQNIMLKQDPNAVLPDHYLPKKGSNSVSQAGQDNHHNTLYRTGKEEERGKI